MSDRIGLAVVDDHTLFRRGLVALLSQDQRFRVMGEAEDIYTASKLLQTIQPDLLLLDIDMPGIRGVDAIASIKQDHPALRILMLTVSEDADDLFTALQNGADGYLLKTADSDQLCDAIARVYEGQFIVSPDMMTHLVAALRQPVRGDGPGSVSTDLPESELDRLSPREMEIFLLIAQSMSNKQIAKDLDIAETTVKVHVQHIMKKLGFTSRVQIAVFAASCGKV
jgi:two-component system nitrate/nitrite response regulator NarL